MKNKLKLVFTLLVLLVSLRHVSAAFAQGALDISLSPSVGYLKVQPGGQATHTITLENTGNQTLVVSPKIVDFTSDGRTGVPVLANMHSFPYFDFDANNLEVLTLKPQTKAQLSIHMQVPQDAVNREYPLSVLFESKPLEDFSLGGASAQINSIVGSNLVILVTDETTPPVNLKIKSMQTSKIVDSFRAIQFSPLIENTGYAASIASGSAQISNWRGKIVKQFQLKPATVLGSSSRELEAFINENTSVTPFSYKPLFSFGLYTISVKLEYKNNDESIFIEKNEKIFSFPLFFTGLVVLSTSGYFYYTRMKKQ